MGAHRLPSCFERSFAYHLARDTWLPTVVSQARLELPRTAEGPRRARLCVREELGVRLGEEEREILEALVTELVSNAVAHSERGPKGTVTLHMALAPERIRVEVCDGGVGFGLAELVKPRAEPGGYGLVMVDRAASRWGIAADEGSCVWFELDRSGSAG